MVILVVGCGDDQHLRRQQHFKDVCSGWPGGEGGREGVCIMCECIVCIFV